MFLFPLTSCLDIDQHHFRLYEASDERAEWLLPMAREYIRLHVQSEARIDAISDRLDTLDFDMTSIKKRLKKSSLPERRPGNFDPVRSDFGELLCYMLLERDYGTVIGVKSIEQRELTDLTGRGIDVIGVEDDGSKVTIVFCEVKVSDERTSPPKVVEKSADSLLNQQLGHILTLSDKTMKKVRRSAKLTRDPSARRILDFVGVCLDNQRLEYLQIVVCNVLVRPKSMYRQEDFGRFYTNPDQFSPASVRFLIACLPARINDIVDEWYALIQQEVSN